MDQSRRRFLQWAGGAVVAAAGAKAAVSALDRRPVRGGAGSDPRDRGFAGTRWGMVVDVRKAAAQWKTLQDACHKAHNVPDIAGATLLPPEERQHHEIKWIWTAPYEGSFPEEHHRFLPEEVEKTPVVVLCNHCDNPPCVRACPTEATFQQRDGIVVMDFHRCIGCRFCVSACPYGARSLNFRDPRPFVAQVDPNFPTRTKGVVEKCNFCAERLAKQQLPACVEAAQDEALVFGDLNDPGSRIRQILKERFTIRRKAGLGTEPMVFYLV